MSSSGDREKYRRNDLLLARLVVQAGNPHWNVDTKLKKHAKMSIMIAA
jgi:hypothetical protein